MLFDGMKKFILSIALLLAALATSATEIVANGNFSGQSKIGLPLGWNLNSPDLSYCSLLNENQTFVRLNVPVKNMVYLIQSGLALTPGIRYTLTYRVRSADRSPYRVYCEWRMPLPDGKYRLQSVNGAFTTASAEWQTKAFSILLPSGAMDPYLVLNVQGIASVDFTDVAITVNQDAAASSAGGVPTSKLDASGGEWKLGTAAALIRDSQRGHWVLRLTPSRDVKAQAQLEHLPVTAGNRYEATFNTWGEGNAGSDTGFYPFRVSVKFTNSIEVEGSWDDTMASAQRKSLIFTVPGRNSKWYVGF